MAARLVSSSCCRWPAVVARVRLVALPVAHTRLQSSSPEKPSVDNPQSSSGLQALLKEKIGVTGTWTLGLGLVATMFSKEIIIFHAETLVGLTMAGVIWYLMKRLGPSTAKYLDDRSQAILDKFNEDKQAVVSNLEKRIADQESVETILSCRKDVFEIMRENSAMEREAEYRRRLSNVATSVKRRLDYQVQMENLQRQFEQRQLVSWIEEQVLQTVQSKPDESLSQCMATLKKLTPTPS